MLSIRLSISWQQCYRLQLFTVREHAADNLCANITQVVKCLNSASSGPVLEGNVGGGAGLQTYEFKGGTGTASRMIAIGDQQYTVAALVQPNFGTRHELSILGVPVGKHLTENVLLTELSGHEQGSIIVIIATDVLCYPCSLNAFPKEAHWVLVELEPLLR